MIIPYSIPAWIEVKNNAKKLGLDINFSVDPTTGKHSGHFFFKDRGYPFTLEIYPKNMILSLKTYNRKLFDIWSKSLKGDYRILYEADTEYPYHAEWYFNCEEEEILGELNRMKNATNIRVFHVK